MIVDSFARIDENLVEEDATVVEQRENRKDKRVTRGMNPIRGAGQPADKQQTLLVDVW